MQMNFHPVRPTQQEREGGKITREICLFCPPVDYQRNKFHCQISKQPLFAFTFPSRLSTSTLPFLFRKWKLILTLTLNRDMRLFQILGLKIDTFSQISTGTNKLFSVTLYKLEREQTLNSPFAFVLFFKRLNQQKFQRSLDLIALNLIQFPFELFNWKRYCLRWKKNWVN